MAIGGAIASIAGGALQASSAQSAANAQQRAAAEQLALQREMYNTTRNDLAPFRDTGGNALAAYNYELGLGAAPTIDGAVYGGINMSPAAQFALNQGVDSIQSSAAARGGLRSGSALRSLEGFRFGLAAQDRESQMNRLAGLVDMGQSSAGMNASNNNAMAQMGSNSFANMGNAQSAGAIGAGNAWGNALGNLAGIFQYQKGLV